MAPKGPHVKYGWRELGNYYDAMANEKRKELETYIQVDRPKVESIIQYCRIARKAFQQSRPEVRPNPVFHPCSETADYPGHFSE